MQMHHSNDENLIRILYIQNSVWKPSDQRSSYIVFHDQPRFWLSKYSLNRRIDFYRQIVPQTFFTFFVELNGPDKFSLSIRMKRVSH